MKKSSLYRGLLVSIVGMVSISPYFMSAADGLFGTYFERMTGLCNQGYVITGFSTGSGSFGTQSCTSLRDILGLLYGSLSAPEGQAMLGFNASGDPIFGSVNWTRNAGDIGFLGGSVGIGTTTPTARLDVSGGDAIINNLTVGRGGGGVSNNVAIGQLALQNNLATSSSNVAVGAQALMTNNIGTQNTAIGTVALRNNTSGENNIGIGSNALQANITGGWNTAIGSAALYGNITGGWNTAIGSQSLYNNTSGINNIGLGVFAGGNITSGTNNIAIGYYASVPNGAASNQIRLGNTLVTYAGIQVPWTITSDIRLKSDIKKLTLGIDFVRQLSPVSYIRKNDLQNSHEFGFIAQDIEGVLTKLNYNNLGLVSTDDLGIKSVRYNDLIAPIVLSIQELDLSHQELVDIVEAQNSEIISLNSRIKVLEDAVLNK